MFSRVLFACAVLSFLSVQALAADAAKVKIFQGTKELKCDDTFSFVIGKEEAFTAKTFDAAGKEFTAQIKWTSDKELKVVSDSKSPALSKVTATAKPSGTAWLTAFVENADKKKVKCELMANIKPKQ